MSIIVPNLIPKHVGQHRIAVVGEAPGADEELAGRPFVGPSGALLKSVLEGTGLIPDHLYIGNVCQIRPPSNDIQAFDFTGPEIQGGLDTLRSELQAFLPNIILCLGNTPLHATHPHGSDASIGNWRGSVYWSETFNCKCLATFHPAYILRVFGDLPLLRADIQKAKRHSLTRDLVLPARSFITHPSLEDVRAYISRIRNERRRIYIDVEGWANHIGITMLGIATDPQNAFVVPFWLNGQHYWSESDECEVWSLVSGLLADENIEKVLQNALYEWFILHWKHRLILSNVVGDTMLKHFEIFPEMDKGLDLQVSLYTDIPYYKDQRGVGGDAELVYNATDCVATAECDIAQESIIKNINRSAEHYAFNVSLLPAINYMQLRGCLLDTARLASHLEVVEKEIATLQLELNNMVGREINAKSNPDKQWFLYEFLDYKPYEKYGKTAKEEVLHRYYQREKNPALRVLIQLVAKRTRRSDIHKLTANADGRIRCSYNLVGTSTCRISSSESNALEPYFTKSGLLKWEGSGTNLQNQTDELRDVFVADAGFDFWQIDLEGADGWTVAADLAALGCPTMLDDYLAGIKPAKVLYLMLEAHERKENPATINNLPRAELKARVDAIHFEKKRDAEGRPGDWKYLCMKRCQHGTNYAMEADKLSATIFKDSDGLIDLTKNEAAVYQYLYRLRYNPDARKTYIERELRDKGYLNTASGFRRKFNSIRYGRPDPSVVREALSLEPQCNTTYVCNRALQNLWYAPNNRTSRGALFVEPLLQIHDALGGQWGQRYRDWAITQLREWFTVPLTIHGIQITIPYSGGYGPNWKDTTSKL